jgi:hypothetical protein
MRAISNAASASPAMQDSAMLESGSRRVELDLVTAESIAEGG